MRLPSARPLLRIAVALAALTQLSCAAAGLAPATHSQPAERLGLAPEFRIFYDTLQDQGDWLYIQPVGYVFRPDVNFITWRPYEDGYWAASEIYGWTWISAEPFGWATYHYGSWFYDRYYGWVWAPGRDWGPAWVAWQIADDYAGWSPLLAPGSADPQIRGGPWTFAPLGTLGSTDLVSHVVHESDLKGRVQGGRAVQNLAERGGVVFNRGPRFELIEKAAGSFPRVKIEALEPGSAPGALTTGRAGESKGDTRAGIKGGATGSEKSAPPALIENMRRAALDAARRTRTQVDRGGPPPASVQVIQAVLPPPTGAAKPGAARSPARAPAAGEGGAADTTAH